MTWSCVIPSILGVQDHHSSRHCHIPYEIVMGILLDMGHFVSLYTTKYFLVHMNTHIHTCRKEPVMFVSPNDKDPLR